MNHEGREELLTPFLANRNYGGVRYFKRLPLSVLQILINHHFVEMGPWNDCPGVDQMFLPFLRRNPAFTAHGYVVDHERPDTRITLEGVERVGSLEKHEMIDFCTTFWGADEVELTPSYARCWYD